MDEFALGFEAEEIEKFFARKNDEKYLLNLEEAVRLTLAKAGVKEENIFFRWDFALYIHKSKATASALTEEQNPRIKECSRL